MSEKKKTCQFKDEYNLSYKCPEFALEDSEKGYCIFHEPQEDKDIKKFNEGIQRKFDKKDYGFIGYWFPVSFPFSPQYTFEGWANFEKVTFKEKANFKKAAFKEWANFTGATFQEEPHFIGATFEKWADFIGATFKEEADFVGATFKEEADFGGATFKERADFIGATFEKRADFRGATFKKWVDFRGATFKKSIFLDKIEIKDPTYADILFRKAKILWHNEGNYVEEGECHYQEMDYIRKQKNGFFRYFLDNIFHRCLHGYGEKPHRVIIGAAAIVIVCAFLFMNFGIGETRLAENDLPTYSIPRILLYYLSLSDLANIGRYFYFSAVTFTTLGYGDLRPVHPVSHVISSIEAFVGMFMMALFVLTYGRKWRR